MLVCSRGVRYEARLIEECPENLKKRFLEACDQEGLAAAASRNQSKDAG
jgi:hypothetical protein